MADLVDAADGAAVPTAQAGDQAPPVSKASPATPREPQAVPISVDDTPTEPATSPRCIDPEVQEWAVELQLPTREYGPHPEPEVYPCRCVMNDGQWTEEEHAAHLYKAGQAQMSVRGIEKLVKKPKGTTVSMLKYGRLARPRPSDESQDPSICASWATSQGCFIDASSSRCP